MSNIDYIFFMVKGSTGNIYQTKFWKEGFNFRSSCTCPAGKKWSYCKHRFQLMEGEVTDLVSENIDDIKKLHEFLRDSDVGKIFQEFMDQKDYENVYYKYSRIIDNRPNVRNEVKPPEKNQFITENFSFLETNGVFYLYDMALNYIGNFFLNKKSREIFLIKFSDYLIATENSSIANFYSNNNFLLNKIKNFDKNRIKKLREEMKIAMR
ncbi:MAG: hypothetical protein ACRCSK_06315 [Fusobacteriaceae bacterium]